MHISHWRDIERSLLTKPLDHTTDDQHHFEWLCEKLGLSTVFAEDAV
jgi:hypothetical protein